MSKEELMERIGFIFNADDTPHRVRAAEKLIDQYAYEYAERVPIRPILENLYHAGWSAHRASLDSRNAKGLRALEETAIEDAEAKIKELPSHGEDRKQTNG